jgi:hypothetical protein
MLSHFYQCILISFHLKGTGHFLRNPLALIFPGSIRFICFLFIFLICLTTSEDDYNLMRGPVATTGLAACLTEINNQSYFIAIDAFFWLVTKKSI